MYVSGLYLLLFLLSLVATYILLRSIVNRRASFYVMLFMLITVVSLAYFAYSIANDTGMVLVANQFTYLDGTFMLMFFLLCVLDICGIRPRPFVVFLLTLCNLFFLALAFTTGKNNLFYLSYKLGTNHGASHIQSELAPLYNLYILYVLLITLAPVCIIIYAIIKKRKMSIKYIAALSSVEVFIVSLYFVENFFNLGFDILPVGYIMMEYVILAIVHRISLYDGSQIVVYNSEERKEYGYIIFDMNKAYVASNNVARYYFPEIESLDIDRAVKNDFIRENFVERLEAAIEGQANFSVFERCGRSIVSTIKPYRTGRKQRIYGYIVELHDDTEQQTLIHTLNDMNVDLEKAVDSANKANHAKSDFLANMSHEIRTPINAILGMNEIALRECKDDKILSYLDDIETAGKNLLFIINDILDFSKIEAGKIEIIAGDYSPAKMIKEVKELLEQKTRDKNLKFIINIDSALPTTLNGDENRIRQILINLLNNAVKYTPQGQVELSVKCVPLTASATSLLLSVKDTGIGIKDEDKDLLFNSFQRLEAGKNKGIEGTGLGLAITSRLVQIMKGQIQVDSVYGEGSTFTVTLPQTVVDSTPIGDFRTYLAGIPAKRASQSHIDASGVNILVVDDSPINLKVAEGLLKATQANVTTCLSGKECLELLAKNCYQIVLLDHMMPEMDGVETLHRAKQLSNTASPAAKYIVLTANALSGAREMYLAEGFDDYLDKPINPGKMEGLIQKYRG